MADRGGRGDGLEWEPPPRRRGIRREQGHDRGEGPLDESFAGWRGSEAPSARGSQETGRGGARAGSSRSGSGTGLYGSEVGSNMAVGVFIGGSVAGSPVNPARALGPIVVAWNNRDTTLPYVLAPVVGGILAAVLYDGFVSKVAAPG